MGKAPSAPNATDTASAQQSANLINQYNPLGSSTYTQTGKGPTGVPTYRQDIKLNPQAQQALNATLGTQTNLANTAQQLSGGIGQELSQPVDWSQQQNYLNNLTDQSLDRAWDRQGQQYETDLVNRGIRPGSTQYQQLQGDFRTDRSNAYNAANVANYNTALQSQLGLRNQRLNELTGLLSAGQVQTPQFGSTPFTDVAGITQNAYGQQMQQYGANQSNLGGLFAAGANLLPLALSDRRAKTDIRRIGTADNGIPLYVFRYFGSGPFFVGPMADEVEKVNPDAVVMGPDNLKRVNYAEAF